MQKPYRNNLIKSELEDQVANKFGQVHSIFINTVQMDIDDWTSSKLPWDGESMLIFRTDAGYVLVERSNIRHWLAKHCDLEFRLLEA